MEGGDADFLALASDVLSGQHGCVRLNNGVSLGVTRTSPCERAYRRLVSVGLDLHTTGDSGDGLLARQVGDVDKGVVEPSQVSLIPTTSNEGNLAENSRGVDVGNAKDELTLLDLGSEGDGGGVLSPDLLGGLRVIS